MGCEEEVSRVFGPRSRTSYLAPSNAYFLFLPPSFDRPRGPLSLSTVYIFFYLVTLRNILPFWCRNVTYALKLSLSSPFHALVPRCRLFLTKKKGVPFSPLYTLPSPLPLPPTVHSHPHPLPAFTTRGETSDVLSATFV